MTLTPTLSHKFVVLCGQDTRNVLRIFFFSFSSAMFGSFVRRVRGALDVVHGYYAPPQAAIAATPNAVPPSDATLNSAMENMLLLKDLSVDEAAASEHDLIEKLKACFSGGGCQVNQLLDSGYTLLQYAVAANSTRLVTWLLDEAGADIMATGSLCSPPLHLACKLGHVSVAKELLVRGALVTAAGAVCFPQGHSSRTACHRLMLPRLLLLGMSGARGECGAEDRKLPVYHAVRFV